MPLAGRQEQEKGDCRLFVCLYSPRYTSKRGKKKFYIYVYHAKAAAEIPKWPLHMLFQMTETISVAVLLNNSVVCNKNIPCPSVCLQY